MNPIKTVSGYLGGTLEIHEKKVVIVKKGIAGFAAGGSNGKEIWMKAITGVLIKKPNLLTNGKFTILNAGENASTVKDENTIIFLKKDLAAFEEAKALIEQMANN